jgi:PAS domain S-box-containing protein
MDDKNKTKDQLIEELRELRLKVEEMEELRVKCDRTKKMMRDAIVRAHDEKEKNEAIISSLGDGISIQDLHFKILYQNSRHKQIVGGDHRGKYCHEAYQRKNSVCEACHLVLSFQDGKVHKNEQSRVTDSGTFYYEIISSPLRNARGEIIAGIEAVRDITDRKRMEHALAESEQRYRAIFETAADAIFIIDAEGENTGKIIAANNAASDMHGYSREELLSMNIQDLNTPDTAKLAPSMISRIIAGETMKTELMHRRKNGTVFSVEVTAVVMEVEGHKYILDFDRDISMRKTTELEKEVLISHLRSALEGIKRLRGLLPICAWCKKVRDDQGYWKQVEKYIEENSEASFTHGICPECMDKVKEEEFLT